MRVLIVNAYDTKGGAARAAYRLHQGLQTINVKSQMLVYQKRAHQDSTVELVSGRWVRQSVRATMWRDRRLRKRLQPTFFWSTNTTDNLLTRKINAMKPDIVHLHWIGDGYLPIQSLKRINAPLVWTLHDMWAFTGGCHHSCGCTRYQHLCGNCPILNSNQTHDMSQRIWSIKHEHWHDLNLNVITPSNWLAECARASSLLRPYLVQVIHNGIDTMDFKPIDKHVARNVLNLPADRHLLLFGALNSTSDPNKGFQHLATALKLLTQRETNLEILIFGANKPDNPPDFGLPVHYLGQLNDTSSLVLAYNAADVFVAPSEQENLSNTVMEALACGVPCVTFNIGGMPDLIQHQYNGYLAEPFSSEDLASGIIWTLAKQEALSANARQTVLKKFELTQIAEQYQVLYEQIISHGAK